MQFEEGKTYTRNKIHQMYLGKPLPRKGTGLWTSGYLNVKDTNDFVIFMNIGTSGTTGHNFPNEYNPETKKVIWFGKPDTHQNQNTFLKIKNNEFTTHFFGRWDKKNVNFEYLGIGSNFNFEDGYPTKNSKGVDTECVKVTLDLKSQSYTAPYEDIDDNDGDGTYEGRIINRNHRIRERSPEVIKNKKNEILKTKGKLVCEGCGFDFSEFYGDRGEGFIECHHTKPVSEMKEGDKTRLEDLVLVCSNCHRIIHRKKPWLSMVQLQELIKR